MHRNNASKCKHEHSAQIRYVTNNLPIGFFPSIRPVSFKRIVYVKHVQVYSKRKKKSIRHNSGTNTIMIK